MESKPNSKPQQDDYNITHWKFPGETIHTIYGDMYYQEWCECEVPRLGEDNHFVVERPVGKHKEICIVRRKT